MSELDSLIRLGELKDKDTVTKDVDRLNILKRLINIANSIHNLYPEFIRDIYLFTYDVLVKRIDELKEVIFFIDLSTTKDSVDTDIFDMFKNYVIDEFPEYTDKIKINVIPYKEYVSGNGMLLTTNDEYIIDYDMMSVEVFSMLYYIRELCPCDMYLCKEWSYVEHGTVILSTRSLEDESVLMQNIEEISKIFSTPIDFGDNSGIVTVMILRGLKDLDINLHVEEFDINGKEVVGLNKFYE